jgi:hypothetical protein
MLLVSIWWVDNHKNKKDQFVHQNLENEQI